MYTHTHTLWHRWSTRPPLPGSLLHPRQGSGGVDNQGLWAPPGSKQIKLVQLHVYKYSWTYTKIKIFRADNPVALYNVATHYFAGKGVELSFEKAAEYFEKAAILQFPPAQVGIANTVLVHYYNM